MSRIYYFLFLWRFGLQELISAKFYPVKEASSRIYCFFISAEVWFAGINIRQILPCKRSILGFEEI